MSLIEAALEQAHGILLQVGTRGRHSRARVHRAGPPPHADRARLHPDVVRRAHERPPRRRHRTAGAPRARGSRHLRRRLRMHRLGHYPRPRDRDSAARTVASQPAPGVAVVGDDEFFTLKSAILARRKETYAIGSIPDIEGEFRAPPSSSTATVSRSISTTRRSPRRLSRSRGRSRR